MNELIQHAQTEDIVYAVPGHPRVAETTTAQLLEYSQSHNDIQVEILGGKALLTTF